MNVNNKKDGVNVENSIKTEDDMKVQNDTKENNKIIDDVWFFYIGEECNNLIDRIFKIGLVDSDFVSQEF